MLKTRARTTKINISFGKLALFKSSDLSVANRNILLVTLGFLSPAALAQTPDIADIVPRAVPATQETGEIVGASEAVEIQNADRETVLVDSLSGLYFTGNPEIGSASVSGLVVENLRLPDEPAFRERLAPFLGQPLTLGLLDRINREVIRHYRANDIPVVDAFAPQGQYITEGNVRIVVLTGTVGEVRVEGARYFSPESIRSQVRLNSGDALSTQLLQEDVQWLNSNPFRNVGILLERGATFGETDIVLNVEDRFPVRVYGGVEDSGTEATGKERMLTGVNWGNAFGLGHQLGYQFTSAFDSDELVSHSLSYLMPLPTRHTLSFYAAQVKADPPADVNGFNLTGKSWQSGLRYTYPLAALNNIDHDVQAGIDFKRSNNNLQFGAQNVFDTYTNVVQASLAYNASKPDEYGFTGLGLSVNYSPGGIGSDNTDAAFQTSRANATAEYVYARLNLNRITRLPNDYTWSITAEAQFSNRNLLGSEQLGIGGYRTVRGFDEYAGVGDEGVIVKSELRTPAWTVFPRLNENGYSDNLQLLAFLDYGVVSNVDELAGENSIDMLSAGLGLRYTVSPAMSLRADYGWQLNELTPASGKDSRLHFSVVLGF